MNDGGTPPSKRVVNLRNAMVMGVLASLTAGGCETIVDDDPPVFDPVSVPEDKPLDDLDEDEQDAFCDEALDFANEVFAAVPKLECVTVGLEAAVGPDGSIDRAACEAAEQECLQNPPDSGINPSDLQCDLSNLDSCDATVGEYAACVEELAALFDAIVEDTTCAKFAAGDLPDADDYALDPACEALFEACGEDETQSEPVPPE
ncbi:MAG: hypothetical protein AAGA54_13145 [Myxococcota bacterium]